MPLLEVHGLRKRFTSQGFWKKKQVVTAVDEVSLHVEKGETLALVGESGSGKSTTARLIMRLMDADEGNIYLLGQEITRLRGADLRRMRKHMQMVFQDPYASLNPRMRIGESVAEGLRVHAPHLSRKERRERVADMLQQCGIDRTAIDRYPHQFSGGQRQRIGIARAVIVRPELLILDEPVSALDVSIQAQILNLLDELKRRHGLAYLFISHDLSVVRHVADRIAVMFAGRIVETGKAHEVFHSPRHPYTQSLLEARCAIHPKLRKATNEVPPPLAPPATGGCPYRLRCPYRQSNCDDYDGRIRNGGHAVACLHPLA